MFGLRKPKKTYQCSICNHEGKTLTSLKNHFKKKHSFENECLFCEESVTNLNTHALKRHISHKFRCGICKEDFATTDTIKMHYINHHSTPENSMFNEIETAFNRRVMTFSCNFPDMGITNLEMIGEHIHHHATELIKHQLRLQHLVRFSIIMIAEFVDQEIQKAYHISCCPSVVPSLKPVFFAQRDRSCSGDTGSKDGSSSRRSNYLRRSCYFGNVRADR